MKYIALSSAFLAVAVASCGEHSPASLTGPSSPSPVLMTQAMEPASEALFSSTAASCAIQRVSTAQGRIDLVAPSNDAYAFRAERHDQTHGVNAWVSVQPAFVKAGHERWEWSRVPAGTYRIAARCNGGDWSAWAQVSVDGGEPIPAAQPEHAVSTPGGPALVAQACTTHLFWTTVNRSVILPLAVPAGPHTLRVTTYDTDHHAGYQPSQVNEQLGVYLAGPTFIGLTEDIPETAPSMVTSFDVTGPSSHVGLYTQFPSNSVHGACVEVWTR